MTDFPFNTLIPAAANNPSVDQPQMLSNNVENALIWNVDHLGFNVLNGGTHSQLTFVNNSYITPPVMPAGNACYFYTNPGVESTAAQGYFLNSNVTVPVTALRAFGSFTTLAAPTVPTFLTQYNVDIATVTHPGNYVIPLTTNATSSNNVAVLISSSIPIGGGLLYSFAGNTLTITAFGGGTIINFAILQI